MTVRIALASLAVVLAAMAYPWESTTDWWILGIAAAVVVVVFAWWRGQFVTTMIGRRLAVWRRNHSKPKAQRTDQATVVVRVDGPQGAEVSLPLVAGYVERFGVRSEKVRVTNRDHDGVRTTWISLTLDAKANLVALQARSPELPLRDTAEIAGRRLTDHLREAGLDAAIVDETAAPLGAAGREKWSGVVDDHGFVSVHGIPVDERLGERLAEVWSQSGETWTAIEFSGTAAQPVVAAACAFRTADVERKASLSGLTAHRGLQRPLLTALDPKAVGRLGIPSKPVSRELLERIAWPAGSRPEFSRT
ncbi:type VII secretion protein EccE [Mycolicibacterium celeriflavum]|uniref:ESX-3 secretion system protein EccE3 n=1 Tax=Mycolicibacterium celeriflavum TaxID=1249101 RepID=A0A1X0BNN1_MYCCF|nr:type VII secretion protein EccE [Mycolicibacterium celeriflavum]ORA44661.1 type VII secretion protein EccE [Mycolicibacterium celeriflavum]BBY44628.1 ESX-3 secretion system protein EccE3 [Mycolicibacterium celeriflavum]